MRNLMFSFAMTESHFVFDEQLDKLRYFASHLIRYLKNANWHVHTMFMCFCEIKHSNSTSPPPVTDIIIFKASIR